MNGRAALVYGWWRIDEVVSFGELAASSIEWATDLAESFIVVDGEVMAEWRGCWSGRI